MSVRLGVFRGWSGKGRKTFGILPFHLAPISFSLRIDFKLSSEKEKPGIKTTLLTLLCSLNDKSVLVTFCEKQKN